MERACLSDRDNTNSADPSVAGQVNRGLKKLKNMKPPGGRVRSPDRFPKPVWSGLFSPLDISKNYPKKFN